MLRSEQASKQTNDASTVDALAKRVLLSLFNKMTKGFFTLSEHGHVIATYGDPADPLRADVNVVDMAFYRRFLSGGSISAGDTFADGLWQTTNLTAVIQFFARNMAVIDAVEQRFSWLTLPISKLQHWSNKNSKSQSKKNIAAHYDLGNALYEEFLDESMMYSSAIYSPTANTLALAQQNKLKTICDKLKLTASDHLMEIGTGWGSLAIFAAQNYGCQVTTTTISEEQYRWAEEKVAALGLQDKVTLLKKDYRELDGQYDKLVSIEMIEAVGKEYLKTFFQTCSRLLKPNGLMLLQSITINDQRYASYSNGVDFIQRYIFPGGFLPSIEKIGKMTAKHTDMVMRDCHDIGLDYAQTLKDWHTTFNANTENLANAGYDELFRRMWEFYFCYCEGGFRERTISAVQIQFSKPEYYAPIIR